MKKQNLILSAALVAVFSASTAFAEAEVTGKIVHESAKFTTSGIGIGAATTAIQTADSHGKDNFKQETTAKIYIDDSIDELAEGATYHVELNLMKDGKALNDYDSNESYTQRDALREAYVDMEQGDWSIRAGKQQVVWGTADGMKLLDTINPTDYSEMAQNQMEDSRIPVWMINAETDTANGGSFQAILSQAKENKIAGLNASGDQGHAFVMKGVDSITGKVNGFLNVTPALAGVAQTFNGLAGAFGFSSNGNLAMFSRASVDGFANNTGAATTFAGACNYPQYGSLSGTTTSSRCLDNIAQAGMLTSLTDANNDVTNLIDAHATTDTTSGAAASWDIANANSAFEYMPNATFATFNTFAGGSSEYIRDYNNEANFGGRYKGALSNGLNYSFNFMNHMDSNPTVSVAWYDQTTNEKLTTEIRQAGATNTAMGAVGGYHPVGAVVAVGDLATTYVAATAETVLLKNAAGEYYGAKDPDVNNELAAGYTTNLTKLRFTEKTNRMNSLGGSFDMAVETANLGPVVVRGEVLYDADTHTPVVDKRALGIGDLEHGLTSRKADFFKYVVGADVTVLTNMMVSGQFIQLRNLDYVENTRTCTAESGTTFDCSEYTGDSATLHMTNGMNKAEENKEFYSLFLSKPFGASGEHRWNNIFMFEENGGKWNRLDAEFSIDDDTQATVEYNKYWGDANTQFGQLEKSSNIQVGVKYSF